jgi:hypothetical protein
VGLGVCEGTEFKGNLEEIQWKMKQKETKRRKKKEKAANRDLYEQIQTFGDETNTLKQEKAFGTRLEGADRHLRPGADLRKWGNPWVRQGENKENGFWILDVDPLSSFETASGTIWELRDGIWDLLNERKQGKSLENRPNLFKNKGNPSIYRYSGASRGIFQWIRKHNRL